MANEAKAIQVDHVVRATPENLRWGWFPVDKAPVITVRPGDVVEMYTLTGFGADGWSEPVTNLGEVGIAASDVPEELVSFWNTRKSRPREGRNGHLITGPVYIEGAEPGDVTQSSRVVGSRDGTVAGGSGGNGEMVGDHRESGVMTNLARDHRVVALDLRRHGSVVRTHEWQA